MAWKVLSKKLYIYLYIYIIQIILLKLMIAGV